MTIENLVIYAAAVWYLSYSLTNTHGPFGLFERLRAGAWHGGLLKCQVCLSLWIAALILILHWLGLDIVIHALAIAGVSLWIHRYTGWSVKL